MAAARNLRLIFRYLTITELCVFQTYNINNCHYNSLADLISANMSLPPTLRVVASPVDRLPVESQDRRYGVIVQVSEKPPDVLAGGAVQAFPASYALIRVLQASRQVVTSGAEGCARGR